jgi:16S rRNA G966 N2-methylase RsmD
MSLRHRSAGTKRHDRAYLLSDAKRNDVLELSEVEQYGQDSFNDPDYVSVYGLKPKEWYGRGVRMLARTAVECTRDELADRIGSDIAAVAAADPTLAGSVIVDPFAGSANTLYWIERHVSARQSIGFELDDGVFEASHNNLSILGLGIELVHVGYEAGLAALRITHDQLLIVFIAPPWGEALSAVSGLDLRRTTPPVAAIVDLIATTFPMRKILLAVQVYESMVPDSLAELTSQLEWWQLKTYAFDTSGHNQGLLLGSLGWMP